MRAPAIFILAVFCLGALGIEARSFNYDENPVNNFHRRFSRQIVPGTKWCGRGDIASSDDDLGRIKDTDKCCREHDKCPMNIHALETKYGLTNPDLSTRSHCDCDKKFFDCLLNTTSEISSTIGSLYFNFLRKQCFRKKGCPPGKTCADEYEWVKANVWLPTEAELKKMQHNIALLIPELEFDF